MYKFVVILANGQTVDIESCSIGVENDSSFAPIPIEDLMNIWSAVVVAQDDIAIMADINDPTDADYIAAKQEFDDICSNLFTATDDSDEEYEGAFTRPAKEEYEN